MATSTIPPPAGEVPGRAVQPDLLLRTPLRPCVPCARCRAEVEQGLAHLCPGGAAEQAEGSR